MKKIVLGVWLAVWAGFIVLIALPSTFLPIHSCFSTQQLAFDRWVKASNVNQGFLSRHDGLTALSLWISFDRQITPDNLPNLNLSEIQDSREVFPMRFTEGVILEDGEIYFDFDPINTSNGKRYAFTINQSKTLDFSFQATSEDRYQHGDLSIAEYPIEGDLVFQAHYQIPFSESVRSAISIIVREAGILLPILLVFLSSTALMSGGARRLMGLDATSSISIGLATSLILLVLIGFTQLLTGWSLSSPLSILLFVSLGLLGTYWWIQNGNYHKSEVWYTIGYCTYLIIYFVLSINFLSEIPLPPYIDGIEHYSIVDNLMKLDQRGVEILGNIHHGSYYHIGIHSIASTLILTFNLIPSKVMIIIGQILLVIAIGSLYFPLYELTGNRNTALISLIITSLIWSMPGYALNWSKYPALATIAVFPALIGLFLRLSEKKKSIYDVIWILFLSLGITLLHTRGVLLVLTGGIAAYLLSKFLNVIRTDIFHDRRTKIGILLIEVLLLLLIILPIFIEQVGDFIPAIGIRYWNDGNIFLIGLFLLSFFALRRMDYKMAIIPLFICLLIIIQTSGPYPYIPTGRLIDRPFGEMVFFIPLALLLATALQTYSWDSNLLTQESLYKLCIPLIFLLTTVGFVRRDWLPDSCCQLIDEDRMEALEQLVKVNSIRGKLLIPAERWESEDLVPVDEGGWLSTLFNIDTQKWLLSESITSEKNLKDLCDLGVHYVFSGLSENSFSNKELIDSPAYDLYAENEGLKLFINNSCSTEKVIDDL